MNSRKRCKNKMWIVAKLKKNEISLFEKEIRKKLDNSFFLYNPKIELQRFYKTKVKKYQKSILGDYVFCYHKSFNDILTLNKLRFVKGLKFFLNRSSLGQKDIADFINYCKSFEDEKGLITSGFFKSLLCNEAKFISGPFKNIIFKVIEKQKQKLKVLIGDKITIISDKRNYLYQPI